MNKLLNKGNNMKQDKFFKYANKITQAGDFLLDHGFKASQVVEISQAFLSLAMVESRIVRECRKQALDTALTCFNEYGHSLILKGLKLAEERKMTDQELIEVVNRNKIYVNYFNNELLCKVMTSLLTYSAIGYEATVNEQGEKNEEI